ncbi:MAG TPA: hypothetical protein VNI83_13655 [Vicinamibacterales bacterium]|nr:hypothetical protein [Vicinamibacterales bacterium]
MTAPSPPFAVWFDERLVEGAVLAAAPRQPFEERYGFHREREAIYEIGEPDARERAFGSLFARWFERWQLARPVHRALAEQPLLAVRTSGCRVGPALGPPDEGADLYRPLDSPGQPPEVGVRLRPVVLVERDACLALLRHELQHLVDMLDPAFGYDRDLPPLEGGPAYDTLVRQRYHLVWDITIDGRLVRRALLPETVRARRFGEFARSFPALGPELGDRFARWFDDPQPTHRAILEFVLARAARTPARSPDETTVVCPVCRFPTAAGAFVTAVASEVAELVARRYPTWRPESGLCRQCRDLFEARLGAH